MNKEALIDKARTPLSVIAIFAALSEIAMTVTLFQIDKDIQPVFIWFVMLFPVMLVACFFFTLYTKPAVLFSPSDYEKDTTYLSSINQKKEFDELSAQVETLAETSKTLQAYLEAVVEKLEPDKSSEIISAEKERLKEAEYFSSLERIGLFKFIVDELQMEPEVAEELLQDSTIDDLPKRVYDATSSKKKSDRLVRLISQFPKTRMDLELIKNLKERV